MPFLFNNVTIIGVGLIGGSLAKVLKAKDLARRITGAGRSNATLDQALELGVIDRRGRGMTSAVEDADLVVLASPVGTFEQIAREIGPHLKPGAILTDVGSVKGALIEKIENIIPAGSHYVPAHPIAGREKSGVAESMETLFQGHKSRQQLSQPGTSPRFCLLPGPEHPREPRQFRKAQNVIRASHAHGGHAARLDDEQQRPAVNESQSRMIAFL